MWSTRKCEKVPVLKERLTKDEVILRSYTGERLGVAGVLKVDVTHNSEVYDLPLVVVNGAGQNLLGRNWLQTLKIAWKTVCLLYMDTWLLMKVV